MLQIILFSFSLCNLVAKQLFLNVIPHLCFFKQYRAQFPYFNCFAGRSAQHGHVVLHQFVASPQLSTSLAHLQQQGPQIGPGGDVHPFGLQPHLKQ